MKEGEKKPKIRVLRSYRHPRSSALVVEIETDFGYRGNVNIPPPLLVGLPESDMKAKVRRILEQLYEQQKKICDAKEKAKLDKIASELKGQEF